MKKIGMIVAVEIEAVLSKYGKPSSHLTECGFDIMKYNCKGYELIITKSGEGELAAAAAVQHLISKHGVDMVVNFGVVGGLTPEMSKAKTCIVERVVHYQFDLSEIDPVKVGQHTGYDDIYLYPDKKLFKKALELHPELLPVTCASGDRFVGKAEDKVALNRDFDAEICEMEAAGIVLTCDRCGVPCLLIKTVSDGITGGAEEFFKEVSRSADICLEITDEIMAVL